MSECENGAANFFVDGKLNIEGSFAGIIQNHAERVTVDSRVVTSANATLNDVVTRLGADGAARIAGGLRAFT